ncbi:VirB6/TrbL-like conjugal transfer protein, CD1112 family [Butyrivibrio sp. INlla16]|uniref:VirB6/TrbL-like conjugal transfer protein, CD1112 family n=1 Tax=Butyrivibrio sp. INlla16 TaxID=1520807 RepID=UPI0008877BD2|nr:CD0415/CD1112 family protein [Butyrivibrio sp. INlla16]SDB49756.1 hypothetical protein SAMN02910263_02466 [Butyrivibrio sp. INlla16]
MNPLDWIEDFFINMFNGASESNLSSLMTTMNDRVQNVTTDVSTSPDAWNTSIFTIIQTISDDVMVPIAAIIVTLVMCYEIIQMIIDKNNFSDGDETAMFFKWIFKAVVSIYFVTHCFDITMAIFDVGCHVVEEAGNLLTGTIDLTTTQDSLLSIFDSEKDNLTVSQAFTIMIETTIIRLLFNVMAIIVTCVCYYRMITIYLYVSVSPVTFATLGNREMGQLGKHYIKSLLGLAFQGFFIIVCFAIYVSMMGSFSPSTDLSTALWGAVGITVVLCATLLSSGRISESIFGA